MRPTSYPALLACALIAWTLHVLANAWRWVKYAAVGLLMAVAGSAGAQHESEYTRIWCTKHNGEQEYMLSDRTRVDCLTDEYAVEVDRPQRWAEAIGQSLYYAAMTDRAPGIALIVSPDDDRYVRRIRLAEKVHDLGVQLWLIPKAGYE